MAKERDSATLSNLLKAAQNWVTSSSEEEKVEANDNNNTDKELLGDSIVNPFSKYENSRN